MRLIENEHHSLQGLQHRVTLFYNVVFINNDTALCNGKMKIEKNILLPEAANLNVEPKLKACFPIDTYTF